MITSLAFVFHSLMFGLAIIRLHFIHIQYSAKFTSQPPTLEPLTAQVKIMLQWHLSMGQRSVRPLVDAYRRHSSI